MTHNAIMSIFLGGAFALVLGGPLAQAADKSAAPDKGKTVSVSLGEQNGSSESGTAQLSAEGPDRTRVVLTLKGGPGKVAQPAHIHEGSCAKLDPKPKYPLSSVENGRSTSVVPASMDSLLNGKMAINVHKSSEDIKTYVACGDLKASTK